MKPLGILILICGALFLIVGFASDTTVSAGEGRRVHNIGLMNEKQNTIVFGAAIAIVGAIFFGFGSRNISSSAADTRQCAYCAEQIKSEAVLCRFCNRDVSPQPPIITHDELMAQFGISHNGEQYEYRQHRYDKIEDAVAYARQQKLITD